MSFVESPVALVYAQVGWIPYLAVAVTFVVGEGTDVFTSVGVFHNALAVSLAGGGGAFAYVILCLLLGRGRTRKRGGSWR